MIPVALVGFMLPAILCSGLIISTFAVMPKTALVGLLLSDLLHLAFQGAWQEESRRERAVDEEIGPYPDPDGCEKSVCLGPKVVPTDVPRMHATTQA
jgi:hypothetical protein